MKFNLFGSKVELKEQEKIIVINEREITFEKMDSISKECKHVSRIYKPFPLLLYQDYKNGKIHNWDSFKEV